MDKRESSPLELTEEDSSQAVGGRRAPPPEPEMLPADWATSPNLPPPPQDTPFENIDWNKLLQDGAFPRGTPRPRGRLIEA